MSEFVFPNPFTTQSRDLKTVYQEPAENIVEKEGNAGKHVLPFPKQISIFKSRLFCCLQLLSVSTSLNFCHLEDR